MSGLMRGLILASPLSLTLWWLILHCIGALLKIH
jgi:hypothetical protein